MARCARFDVKVAKDLRPLREKMRKQFELRVENLAPRVHHVRDDNMHVGAQWLASCSETARRRGGKLM